MDTSRKRGPIRLWSDQEFCTRVVKRCEDLGRSQRDVLKAAGVAHDYLQTDPGHGRRIDRVARIAEVLDWTLADALGLQLSGQISSPLAKTSFETTCMALQIKIPDLARFAEVFVAMYNYLADQHAAGEPVDEPSLRILAQYEAKRTQAALSST